MLVETKSLPHAPFKAPLHVAMVVGSVSGQCWTLVDQGTHLPARVAFRMSASRLLGAARARVPWSAAAAPICLLVVGQACAHRCHA